MTSDLRIVLSLYEVHENMNKTVALTTDTYIHTQAVHTVCDSINKTLFRSFEMEICGKSRHKCLVGSFVAFHGHSLQDAVFMAVGGRILRLPMRTQS
jgi:hypothetical protein